MKLRKLLTTAALAQAAATVMVVGAPPASAETWTRTCHTASEDADGDGYARPGAKGVGVTVPAGTLNCPSGYATFTDDCNDATTAVHPRRAEVASNGVDDDCEGGIDEAEPVYFNALAGQTTTSFSLLVRVNDAAQAALGSAAKGQVEVASLRANDLDIRSPQPMPVYSVNGVKYAKLTIGGLEPTTAYKARIRFYTGAGTEIGPLSNWYYTTTDGTAELSKTRTALVLRALYEVYQSDQGLVGYRGTTKVDGTRYGASVNELWCSEFYVWTTKYHLNGIAGRSSVDEVVAYFSSYGSYYTGAEIDAKAARGDYVAMDTNADGKKNHSGMVLARYAYGGKQYLWAVEGNKANRVAVVKREIGPEVKGLGHIVSYLLS
jgi:hypothetical protein